MLEFLATFFFLLFSCFFLSFLYFFFFFCVSWLVCFPNISLYSHPQAPLSQCHVLFIYVCMCGKFICLPSCSCWTTCNIYRSTSAACSHSCIFSWQLHAALACHVRDFHLSGAAAVSLQRPWLFIFTSSTHTSVATFCLLAAQCNLQQTQPVVATWLCACVSSFFFFPPFLCCCWRWNCHVATLPSAADAGCNYKFSYNILAGCICCFS